MVVYHLSGSGTYTITGTARDEDSGKSVPATEEVATFTGGAYYLTENRWDMIDSIVMGGDAAGGTIGVDVFFYLVHVFKEDEDFELLGFDAEEEDRDVVLEDRPSPALGPRL